MNYYPPGTIACCLRYVNSTTWEILNNAAHTPLGVSSVEIVANDRLRLTYDFTASEVHTVAVTVDETFDKYQVTCGASVGLTYMDIFFHMPGTNPRPDIDPGTLSVSGANVWVFGLFEVAE